jgi:hypothetical protein
LCLLIFCLRRFFSEPIQVSLLVPASILADQ